MRTRRYYVSVARKRGGPTLTVSARSRWRAISRAQQAFSIEQSLEYAASDMDVDRDELHAWLRGENWEKESDAVLVALK